MASVSDIIRQARAALERHYGARLKGVILHGSVARSRFDAASDIDLLVLLNQPFDYFSELRQIIEILYPIQLESDHLISARPVPFDEFDRGSIQLCRNVKKEGVFI